MNKVARRELLVAAVWDVVMLAVAMGLLFALVGYAKADCALPPGTVLASRNHNEAENTSPGYWNHLAIVTKPTEIVEEQGGIMDGKPPGVRITPLATYLARDISVVAFKPLDLEAGKRAAQRAVALVGKPYRTISSLFVHQGCVRQALGMNCVTAALEIPWGAENPSIRWLVRPDGIFLCTKTFQAPTTIK